MSLMDKKWLELRIKMLRYGVTFRAIGKDHGISKQRAWQIIQKGYPAKGRAKAVLDDFYGRL